MRMVQTHAIQRGRRRKYQPTTHDSPPPKSPHTAAHASRHPFGWGSPRFHVVSPLKTKKLTSFLVDQTKYVKFDVKKRFFYEPPRYKKKTEESKYAREKNSTSNNSKDIIMLVLRWTCFILFIFIKVTR